MTRQCDARSPAARRPHAEISSKWEKIPTAGMHPVRTECLFSSMLLWIVHSKKTLLFVRRVFDSLNDQITTFSNTICRKPPRQHRGQIHWLWNNDHPDSWPWPC